MGDVEAWYRSIPIVTRSYATLATITMAAVSTEMVSVLQLYLNWNSIIYKKEIWRVVTSFFFFGTFNIDFFFHVYFMYRYCRNLEENMTHKSADFFWMLFIGSILLLAMSPFFSTPFMASPITFMAVYVFGRRNEYLQMSFLGLFNFTAPYLPWVLMGFSLLLGGANTILADVMGVIVGHIYFYVTHIYPQIGGINLLATPNIVLWIFGQGEYRRVPHANVPHAHDHVDEDAQEQELVQDELD